MWIIKKIFDPLKDPLDFDHIIVHTYVIYINCQVSAGNKMYITQRAM
jgi:hypothetical protein